MIVGNLSDEQLEMLKKNNIDYNNESNVSNEQLLQRYIECDILAFISTFEGFGMPIVEANAVGRVVITSNVTSMPEVANDAACLVDPFNIDSINTGLRKIINDEDYRNTLIQNGRRNYLRFNADKIANMYYNIYENTYSHQ